MTAQSLADHIMTLMDKRLDKRWKAYKVQELIAAYTVELKTPLSDDESIRRVQVAMRESRPNA